MELKEFSLEELHDEMVRREDLEKLANKPQPLEEPDLTDLRNILTKHIDNIFNATLDDDSSIDHVIKVIALKAFYGENIYDWIRQNE